MSKQYDVEQALAALDSYGKYKKYEGSLENARNKEQIAKYLQTLDLSLRKMLILQESVNELVEDKKRLIIKQEHIQTYKTKVINLSRQFNMSYDEVIQVMKTQSQQN
ncbi:hypothetical protein [Shewanella waksmanii]|uniref:hypothetical protein n=1 Tax=Shewanella waksmanii TaxID=213783 RepID=UPI00048CEC20|nr:hypothetical protein [Shewanella waksmanii]